MAFIYFLSPTGNDSHAGTSTGTAWLTLAHAHGVLQPGDTLNVLAGTYPWGLNTGSNWNLSGTVGNPITVQAYNGAAVTFTNGTNLSWTAGAPDTYTATQAGLGTYFGQATGSWQIQVAFDRPCTLTHSLADLTSPPAQFLDGGGGLLYNIVFYNSGTNTLTFRSAHPTGENAQVDDPDTEIFLVQNQFAFNQASYVTFSGIDFRYGLYVHQNLASYTDFTEFNIVNCTFKGLGSGLVGGGVNSTYTNCWFDLIAQAFDGYSTGTYTQSNQNWGFYQNGSGLAISNCMVTRNRCGGAFQLGTATLTDVTISAPIEYDNFGNDALIIEDDWTYEDGICINASGLGPNTGDSVNFNISNCYIEVSNAHHTALSFSGQAHNFLSFNVTDNLINAGLNFSDAVPVAHLEGVWDPDGTLNVDSTGPSLIDRNIYMGAGLESNVAFQLNVASDGSNYEGTTYNGFSAYRTALQATTWPTSGGGTARCAAWEANSKTSSFTPIFDTVAIEGVLNAYTFVNAVAYFQAYVAAIQSTLGTTAGPRNLVAPANISYTPFLDHTQDKVTQVA